MADAVVIKNLSITTTVQAQGKKSVLPEITVLCPDRDQGTKAVPAIYDPGSETAQCSICKELLLSFPKWRGHQVFFQPETEKGA